MIETSNLIANAKENYYTNEGKKLLDSSLGPKKYWSILNSFLTNKKMPTIPPSFENGESVVDYPTQAETFNDIPGFWPPKSDCFSTIMDSSYFAYFPASVIS